MKFNKKKTKIFNDPVYGFIRFPEGVIFELISHPWFQRLRRIRQLGLTSLVYPGANHSRFHHALGAMHLMMEALEVLKLKGVKISEKEQEAAVIAILLHDIGHGPFSHALEHSIIAGKSAHEEVSLLIMEELNREFKGKLDLALKIFRNEYSRKFFHQLVSSQLDLDRLDYLNRDSFFTGVSEGVISSERIVKMMHVVEDNLVIEEKGIYSIEKFIISRRLMYWQVYLHKTVLAAEQLLVNILKRARELSLEGQELFMTPSLKYFFERNIRVKELSSEPDFFTHFLQLDDYDIMASIKVWTNHPDYILSELCKNLIYRRLYRVQLQNKPFEPGKINRLKTKFSKKLRVDPAHIGYFVFSDHVSNSAYLPNRFRISILMKDGSLQDIARATDQEYLTKLEGTVKRYFLCQPRD